MGQIRLGKVDAHRVVPVLMIEPISPDRFELRQRQRCEGEWDCQMPLHFTTPYVATPEMTGEVTSPTSPKNFCTWSDAELAM
jgi:hypothetical protein